MDLSIAALLTQDGITNGAIYALLALALVLVFAVTRVIWIPSGEFVAYGTLTLAGLQLGKSPGTIGLLVGMAIVAGAIEAWSCFANGQARTLPRRLLLWTAAPLAIAGLVHWLAPRHRAQPRGRKARRHFAQSGRSVDVFARHVALRVLGRIDRPDHDGLLRLRLSRLTQGLRRRDHRRSDELSAGRGRRAPGRPARIVLVVLGQRVQGSHRLHRDHPGASLAQSHGASP